MSQLSCSIFGHAVWRDVTVRSPPGTNVEAQLEAFAAAAQAAAAQAAPQQQQQQVAAASEQAQHVSVGPAPDELQDARNAVATLTAELVGDTPDKSARPDHNSPLMLQQSPPKSTAKSPAEPAGETSPREQQQERSQASPAKAAAAATTAAATTGTAPMDIDEEPQR